MFDQPNKIKILTIGLLVFYIWSVICTVYLWMTYWTLDNTKLFHLSNFTTLAYDMRQLVLIIALIWAYRYEIKESNSPVGIQGGLVMVLLVMFFRAIEGIATGIIFFPPMSLIDGLIGGTNFVLGLGYCIVVILLLGKKIHSILMTKILFISSLGLHLITQVTAIIQGNPAKYGGMNIIHFSLGIVFYIWSIGLVFEYLNKSHRVRYTLVNE